jgi:hypothetical protein
MAAAEVTGKMAAIGSHQNGLSGLSPKSSSGRNWPVWAQVLISLAILYHITATLAGSLAVDPSSAIERQDAQFFRCYYELINQGYGHRYYSRLDTTVDAHNPRPGATPVIIGEMEFDQPQGGTNSEVVRLPSSERRLVGLRRQRQLDLAYHLASDPRWAASYARHLCKTRGCQRVTIYTQEHRIPDLALVRAAALGPSATMIDLETESTYGPRIKLGEFRCTDF